ncbi:DUF222 domain-containing protein [Specibacter sp. NPDC078692]|uniref:HNH endonuclease signature motif containing protein n=1 Tax=Specibacter sp. NPDC078692 TaxID=3155818 RepID=UPI00342FE6E2
MSIRELFPGGRGGDATQDVAALLAGITLPSIEPFGSDNAELAGLPDRLLYSPSNPAPYPCPEVDPPSVLSVAEGVRDAGLEALAAVKCLEDALAGCKARLVARVAGAAAVERSVWALDGFQRGVAAAGLATEMSFALGIPEPTTATLIEHSVALVGDRPAVLAGLEAGELSWRHAVVMVEEIATLSSMGHVRATDEAVLEGRLLYLAPGTTAYSFMGKARRAREKMFPETIPVRVKEAFAKRKLTCDVGADGMAWLGLHMPAVSASGIYTRCTRLARAMKAEGVRAQRVADAAGTGQDCREHRTLAQLRADIATILLLGQNLPTTATQLVDEAEATLNTGTAGAGSSAGSPAGSGTGSGTGTGTSTGANTGAGQSAGAASRTGSGSGVECGGSGGLGDPGGADGSGSAFRGRIRPHGQAANLEAETEVSPPPGENGATSEVATGGTLSGGPAVAGTATITASPTAAELYFAPDPADPADPAAPVGVGGPAGLATQRCAPDPADTTDLADTTDPAGLTDPADSAGLAGLVGCVAVVGDGSGLVDSVVDGIVEDPEADYLRQLTELAGHGVLVDPPMPEALVLVKVPFLGLLGITDEPAELVGPQGGPVPEEVARKLLSNSSSFLRVLTDPITGEALPLEPQRYTLRAAERAVLQGLAGCCYVPNCPNPVMDTELDHLRAFEFGGPSTMANLRPACKRHHLMKHFKDDKNRRGRRRCIDEPERAGIQLRGWTPQLTKDGRIGWITPSGKYRPPLNTEPDRPEYPKWLKKIISKTTKKPTN